MTTERRWYEPPAPRDWHPDPAQLQRLESATSLRRSVLDRSSTFDRTSLHSSSSGSEVPSLGRSPLERSLRGAINSPAPPLRAVNRGDPPYGIGRAPGPSLPRSVSSPAGVSLSDLNATYVLPRPLWRDSPEAARNPTSTPPPRPRSSSITKYAPLPAISATNDKDTNNNQEPQFVPPPLVRSRTFDVLDTTLEELPTARDDGGTGYQQDGTQEQIQEGDGRNGEDEPCIVTINIEGKTLADYLSHARDGLLKSRPATRYGRPDPSLPPLLPPDLVAALPSSLTPEQWRNQESSQVLKNSLELKLDPFKSEELQTHQNNNSNQELESNVTLGNPEESSTTENLDNNLAVNTPSETSITAFRDTTESSTLEELDSEFKNDALEAVDGLEADTDKGDGNGVFTNEEKHREEANEVRNENVIDVTNNNNLDESSDGYDSDDEDELKEIQSEPQQKTQTNTEENRASFLIKENETLGGDTEEDINVYFKLPNDSLLVASSPPGGTLGRLLGIVERTRVGGKRLEFLPESLDQGDLDKTLVELGILNNTVIYLLREQ